MKSILILTSLTLLILLFSNDIQAQVFLAEDFEFITNPGLPTGWTSIPAAQWTTGTPNEITPAANNKVHISLNTPQHIKAVGVDGSLQASEGALLLLPIIAIPINAKNPTLTFDVAFFGHQLGEPPYEGESIVLVVSKDGGSTWTDVAFIDRVVEPHNSAWESRSFNIHDYAGQENLRIGVRYNNQGGSLLGAAFDNFRIVEGVDGAVISLRAGDKIDPQTNVGYQISGSGTSISGTIKNTGVSAISNFYIKYALGDEPVQSSQLITASLEPTDTFPFPSGLNITIPSDSVFKLKAWIELTEDVDPLNDTIFTKVVGVPYYPLKRPVFEEGTGTWCGWCPRGTVFMDEFSVSHPDASAQISVHNNDPMTISVYNDFMFNYANAYPNLVIDRNAAKDPETIDSAFILAQNNFGFADVNIGLPEINGNVVSLRVTILPVVDIHEPRLALVITESNVKGSGSSWSQNNYYSGGFNGVMGGWEEEDPNVSDVFYHFVARSITPTPDGEPMDLPSVLLSGTTYTATLTATIDDGLWKTEDLQYIALLMNGNNNSILNSAFTPLPELKPTLGNTMTSTFLEEKINQVYLFPNPSPGITYIYIHSNQNDNLKWSIYDMIGKKLKSGDQQLHAGNDYIPLDLSQLAQGSYMIHLHSGNMNKILRLQLLK